MPTDPPTNADFAKVVFNFQKAARHKNAQFAGRLDRVVVAVLEAARPVAGMSQQELRQFAGVTGSVVTAIYRLAQGDPIERVVEVHVPKPPVRQPAPSRGARQTDDWSGSWDNAVKANEGD